MIRHKIRRTASCEPRKRKNPRLFATSDLQPSQSTTATMSTDHQSQASRPHRQTSDSPAIESSDVPKANKKVEIDNGWVNHLRSQARKEREDKDLVNEMFTQAIEAYGAPEDKDRDKIAPDSGGGSTVACPVCSEPVPNNIDGFRAHVQQDAKAHENILDETAMADAFKRLALNQSP